MLIMMIVVICNIIIVLYSCRYFETYIAIRNVQIETT